MNTLKPPEEIFMANNLNVDDDASWEIQHNVIIFSKAVLHAVAKLDKE